MVCNQEVVDLVGGADFISEVGRRCCFRTGGLVLLQLLHRFLEGIEPGVLGRVEVISRLDASVDMVTKVVRRGHLKNVSIEREHLWLNIVKQIGLLHVGSEDFNRYLLEELLDLKF